MHVHEELKKGQRAGYASCFNELLAMVESAIGPFDLLVINGALAVGTAVR
jgi:hypothetical protein